MSFPQPLACTVTAADDGQRLDRWLKRYFPTIPFIGLQKMLRQGKVRVNAQKAEGHARLAAGDVVTLPPPPVGEAPRGREGSAPAYQVTEADMAWLEAATVYEDEVLLVLNKPAGLPAQAGGGQVRSLDRILEGVYGAAKAPKLVHRLDRETTGLIVCAKNRSTAAALAAQFAEKTAEARQGRTHAGVEKTYLAVAVGALKGDAGEVKAPIAKVGPFARVEKNGDFAHTSWRRLGGFEAEGTPCHILACTPHTGRMNQIRVHMAHIGAPLLGDDKYGNAALKELGKRLHRQGKLPLYLHAWRLCFPHPQTGRTLALEAPLPDYFAARVGTLLG